MTNSAPKGLSREAKVWWTRITDEFEVDDNSARLLLGQALEAFDRMRQAQVILGKEGLTTTDRFGQSRGHPMLLTERDSRNAMLKCLGKLNLDIMPAQPR